jgi:hypothetical protein
LLFVCQNEVRSLRKAQAELEGALTLARGEAAGYARQVRQAGGHRMAQATVESAGDSTHSFAKDQPFSQLQFEAGVAWEVSKPVVGLRR